MRTGRKVWAYVFIETRQPRKVVRKVRRVRGVARADGLFGTPDAVAIVERDDIASMDAVIDKIALIPEILSTDSEVSRCVD